MDWVLYDNGLRHERVKTVRVVVPVGPQVEKFTVVNNDDGRTQNCDFSVIDGNILSEQARSKNQKLLVEAEFCYLDYSNMQNSMAMFAFSTFHRKYLFWGKFGPKTQNCQFKLKPSTQTNLNMQNSMVVFTFSFLDHKIPFLGKFGPKIQNCLSWNLVPAIMVIIFWDSLMFYQIFLTAIETKRDY